MALPNSKDKYTNLFPELVVDDIKMLDIWRAWQLSTEFKDKVKVFGEYITAAGDRWDTISEEVYGDRNLWWLLVLFNEIEDPFALYYEDEVPERIKKIKILKPEDIGIVVNEIRRQRLKLELE